MNDLLDTLPAAHVAENSTNVIPRRRPLRARPGHGVDARKIRRLEELGVTTCTVGPSTTGLRSTKDDFLDWIKQFADEVMTTH